MDVSALEVIKDLSSLATCVIIARGGTAHALNAKDERIQSKILELITIDGFPIKLFYKLIIRNKRDVYNEIYVTFIGFLWCPGADLNHRHEDFQSTALPLSYPGKEKQYALGAILLGRHASAVQRDFW